jgi:Uma2 family endonuclease
MAALGLFDRQRVELIEGQIVNMSPMGSEHATTVTLTAHAVERAFGDGYFTRWQMPFGVGESSDPEPDVAVIAGEVRDYTTTHPTSAVLIIEVADTSLAYDRTEKASLYAKAGVMEYWIVNLINRQLEVHRTPVPARESPYGFRYVDKTIFTATEHVTPLAFPAVVIAVADLLP